MKPIPTTKEQVFRRLDKLLNAQERNELANCSDSDLVDYHFGLGLWIRNNWIYKGDGSLEVLFSKEEYGKCYLICCPDTLSETIIEEYRNYLRNKTK